LLDINFAVRLCLTYKLSVLPLGEWDNNGKWKIENGKLLSSALPHGNIPN